MILTRNLVDETNQTIFSGTEVPDFHLILDYGWKPTVPLDYVLQQSRALRLANEACPMDNGGIKGV